MYRSRLKTTTGCDTCRARHKKCDESKPECSGCQRSGLRCKYSMVKKSWRGAASESADRLDSGVVQHQVSRVAAIRYQRTGKENGYQPFSGQMEFDLVMAAPFLIYSTINQPCGTQSRDFSCLVAAALQTSWLRYTFYTYAAAMLSARPRGEDLLCLKYYHAAIQQLRLRLVADIGTDDLLLVAVSTFFLGNVEVHGLARPSFALAHFIAGLQFLQRIPNHRIHSAERSVRSLYRQLAETSLYVIAALIIFHKSPKNVLILINWTTLSKMLESPHHRCRRPLRLQSQLLAELPSFNNVSRILLVLVVLSREQALSESQHHQLRLIQGEIDVLDSQLPLWYGSDVREDIIQVFCFRWRAAIFALRIFAEKLLNPLTCSANPVIRSYLRGCIQNIISYSKCLMSRPEAVWPPPFSQHGLGSNRNITMHWLFLIVISAAYTWEEFDFALPFLARRQGGGDLTHFKRVEAFINAVRVSHNSSRTMECDGRQVSPHNQAHDGLDLLLSTAGPFSVLGLQSPI